MWCAIQMLLLKYSRHNSKVDEPARIPALTGRGYPHAPDTAPTSDRSTAPSARFKIERHLRRY
jgi:hypothetical protein